MWKMQQQMQVILLIVLSLLVSWSWALSDKRLCADPQCEKIISMGKTVINYNPISQGILSFRVNSHVRIKSKGAGTDPELWGVEINGRQGYVPKKFIKELKILIPDKDVTYEVPVMNLNPSKESVVPPIESTIEGPKIPEVLNDNVTTETPPLTVNLTSNKDEIRTAPEVINDVKDTPGVIVVQDKLEIIDGTKIPINSEASVNSQLVKEADASNKVEASKNAFENDIIYNLDNITDDDDDNDDDDEDDDDDDYDDDEIEEQIVALDKDAANDSDKLTVQKEENTNTVIENNKSVVVEEGVKLTLKENINVENKSVHLDKEISAKTESTEADVLRNSSDSAGDLNASTVPEIDIQNTQVPMKENEIKPIKINVPNEIVENVNENNGNVSINQLHQSDQASNIYNENKKTDTVETVETINVVPIASNPTNSETTTPVNLVTEEVVNNKLENDNNMIIDDASVSSNFTSPDLTSSKVTAPVNNIPEENVDNKLKNDNKNIIDVDSIPSNPTNSETTTPVNLVPEDPIASSSTSPDLTNSKVTAPVNNIPEENVPNKLENFGPEMNVTNSEILKSTEIVDSEFDIMETAETENLEVRRVPLSEKEPVDLISGESSKVNAAVEIPSEITTVPTVITEPGFIHNSFLYDLNDSPTTFPPIIVETSTPSPHDFQAPPPSPEINKMNPVENIMQDLPLKFNYENKYKYDEEKVPSYTHTHEHEPVESVKNIPKPPVVENSAQASNEAQPFQKIPIEIGVGVVESLPPVTTEVYSETTVPATAYIPEAITDAPSVAKQEGLFATILNTVNNLISPSDKKEPEPFFDEELHKVLYSGKNPDQSGVDDSYCEKLSPNDCPRNSAAYKSDKKYLNEHECHCGFADIKMDNLVEIIAIKAFEMSELLACLAITAATILMFAFGYYCFCNSSREGDLLAKLNMLERSLLVSHKDNAILKDEVLKYRNKLSSIEDNSFGANDMVIDLKKQLEQELLEKDKLQEHVNSLQKELDSATEAGLELNTIVSELLSNQSGNESIIQSVEQLQAQLNEQQNTILEINANLAEKSRENSELQLMIAEQNARMGGEIASLQQDNDELESEKGHLQTKLEDVKQEFNEDLTKSLEGKNYEIKRLQNEILEWQTKLEDEHTKWQTSLAKVEALEDCLKAVKRDPNVNMKEVIDVAYARAEVLDLQKTRSTLKERLHVEMDARKLLETQLKIATDSVEKFKQDFIQSEKDKLEAQTRLEVLSNYFKDKETQLQKELSLKESMWLKQQGETTSTVDRLTSMKDEIQLLVSQNDALRAEIEAQVAAHKAQTGTLENRAHQNWLDFRQTERRYEEARAEATALRRRLTAIASGNTTDSIISDSLKLPTDLNNAPSPIHMESPGSPLLGLMPRSSFLPPPPFMAPPLPFIGMPPPFVPPGEMRPAPLGRIMSPPPPPPGAPGSAISGGNRYSNHHRLRSDRYYDDEYKSYDDDDYSDGEYVRGDDKRRRRSGNGYDNWHRDTYSPPRSYRSHSPDDNRFNYPTDRDVMSHYDTETDLSPHPSPRDRRNRSSRGSSFRSDGSPPLPSPPVTASGAAAAASIKSSSSTNEHHQNSSRKKPSTNKGVLSSGSEKSQDTKRHGKKRGK